MTKPGFTALNVDIETMQEIDDIKGIEGCKSKTETLRQILRVYREARGFGAIRGGRAMAELSAAESGANSDTNGTGRIPTSLLCSDPLRIGSNAV